MLAWTMFWFNTALFPCCEVFAAAFNDHTENVSQPVFAAPRAHSIDETHSERPHHGPDSPCDSTASAGPAINGECAGLPAKCVQWGEVAINVPLVVGRTAVNHAAILALRDYHPPPLFPLYLQTQRLLI